MLISVLCSRVDEREENDKSHWLVFRKNESDLQHIRLMYVLAQNCVHLFLYGQRGQDRAILAHRKACNCFIFAML